MKFGGSGLDKEVYDWIMNNLPKGKTILELGSGHCSTKLLCEDYTLYSIEQDKRFLNLYKSNYIYAPLIEYKRLDDTTNRWYSIYVLKKTLPKDYDLILIDGPNNSKFRLGFLDNIDLFKKDIPFVFHDTNRPYEKLMVKYLSKILKKKKLNLGFSFMEVLL